MIRKRIAIGLAAAGIGFVVAAGVPTAAAGGKNQAYGHEIPAFKDVFIKLFRMQTELMSMDQLQTASAQLSDSERGAISAFLGADGHLAVRAGLPEDKQKFLDEKYAQSAEIAQQQDFQKVFPHVLAVGNNNLTMEQFKQTVAGLSAEDIASQSFYLGEEGRAAFFAAMDPGRVQVILDASEDWVILETGMRKYKTIAGYTSVLYKQERLGDELQDVEKILVKYREKPKGIYMKWLDGPWKGREVVYNERVLGAGKVRVRESGVLGIIPVTLPVDSDIAKRGTNHIVTEIGLKYLIDMIDFDYKKAVKAGELQRQNHGLSGLDGHQVYKMESILPKEKAKGYYAYRMVHYIDFLRSLEIKAEIYNWDDQLAESYYYTQIEINPGLSDRDFDPENPDYNLK